MKRKIVLTLALFFIVTTFFTVFKVKTSNSIPPRNVKDVLSNSQFSYYGGVGVGNSAGDSVIKIDTSTSFPSRTSNNLFVGDTVSIGIGGSQSTYTVKDVGNTGTIMINTGISAVSAVAGGSIIATRSAIHTVSFEPQVNATGGFWQFLIKASTTVGESMSDKIPDQNGFDSGALIGTTAVTCPWSGVASLGTTVAIALGSPAVTSTYHVIQCALPAGGTNPAGTGATGTIVVGIGNSLLINPSPSHSAAAEGTADVFTYIVRHLDSSSLLLDQTVGKIAVVESVRVTATIDPTLSFSIDSVGTSSVGSTACGGTGTTLSPGAVSTNGDQVIFGSLAIQANNILAQRLSCVTNANVGYVVTVYEDAVMRSIGNTSPTGVAVTIPDTLCNGANCSTTTATAWSTISSTRSEFGYTMYSSYMAGIGASIPFVPGNYKPFGVGVANAQDIMKKPSVPTVTEYASVCYKITATTVQPAADYEGKIIYTATATF